MELLPVGTVVGAHGVRGLARVKPYNPSSPALATGREVWLTAAKVGEPTRFAVLEARPHRGLFLIGLEGVTNPDALRPWIGGRVSVDAAALPAAGENELYHFEALGLEVRTLSGERIGTVEEILSLKPNDVWVVRSSTERGEPREVLIPVVSEIVREIDLTERVARIEPLPGLLDEGRG